MKKALGTIIAAILAKKAGCGCMVIGWTLVCLLVVAPLLVVLTLMGCQWEQISWIFRIALWIQMILIIGSIIF